MAKIKFLTDVLSGFSTEADVSINKAGTRVTFSYDADSRIVLYGDGLKDNPDGTMKAGTVDKVVIFNADGERFAVATGHFQASALADDDNTLADVFAGLIDGKDVITGSNQGDAFLHGGRGNDHLFGKDSADQLSGGRGNDVLTGGTASDLFYFTDEDGAGKDRITDFDISGSDADVLKLDDLTISDVENAGGGDTRLVLSNGGTILIEDVKRADFIDYWASL